MSPAKQSGQSAASAAGDLESWSDYAGHPVTHVAKASSFIRFSLRYDAENKCRAVEPHRFVVDFPPPRSDKQSRAAKRHCALFSLSVVREESLSRDPNAQGSVANHLRYKPQAERRLEPGADEYVEFELLSREHEAPSQQQLRISMGPVRIDSDTGRKEFVRVDMGQCIQIVATDVIKCPRTGARLVQNRWWMCIETLRLLCRVDSIDCTALDEPGAPPQEWVIVLVDAHAPINKKEDLPILQEERNIDDLMEFIDSPPNDRRQLQQQKGKKKRPGRIKDQEAAVCATGSVEQPPPAGEIGVRPSPDFDAPPRPGMLSSDAPSEAAGESDATVDHSAPAVSSTSRPALAESATTPASADVDLSDADLQRYRQLQEDSGRIEVAAKMSVVRELLEVLDGLERADAEIAEDSMAGRAIFAAARKFEDKLQSLGMSRVQALGRPFDARLHRVVGCPEADSAMAVVIEELESGWTLGDEVVRPALVTLG